MNHNKIIIMIKKKHQTPVKGKVEGNNILYISQKNCNPKKILKNSSHATKHNTCNLKKFLTHKSKPTSIAAPKTSLAHWWG